MARATAVSQKVDAVALKAQKTIEHEPKNTEVEDFFHKREESECWVLVIVGI